MANLLFGLTDYYKLEEAAGNRVGVNSNTLAATGAPGRSTSVSPALGYGAHLIAASSQYLGLNTPDATKFSPGTGSFTVACWANFDSLGGARTLMSKYTNLSQEWFLRYDNSLAAIVFQIDNTANGSIFAQVVSPTPIVVGTWYFVVGVFNAATQQLTISVNGESPTGGPVNAAFGVSGINQSTASLQVGAMGGAVFMDGIIDAPAYWSRALTSDGQSQLYNGGLGLEYNWISANEFYTTLNGVSQSYDFLIPANTYTKVVALLTGTVTAGSLKAQTLFEGTTVVDTFGRSQVAKTIRPMNVTRSADLPDEWTIPVNGDTALRFTTSSDFAGSVIIWGRGQGYYLPSDGNLFTGQGSDTGTPTSVASSATAGTLLAANVARKGGIVYNDSTATLYLLEGAGTASSTVFTYKVLPGDTVGLDAGYRGIVSGIWSVATGNARCTEFT